MPTIHCFLLALACSLSLGNLGAPDPYVPTNDGVVEDYAISQVYAIYDAESVSAVILGGTSQVVQGTRYDLRVEVTQSSGDVDICDVSVWYQAWLKDDEALQLSEEISCGVPEESLYEVENYLSSISNNLFAFVAYNDPDFEKSSDGYSLSNVLLAVSSCTRDDVATLQGTDDYRTTCVINEDEFNVENQCKATVAWAGTAFETSDISCWVG